MDNRTRIYFEVWKEYLSSAKIHSGNMSSAMILTTMKEYIEHYAKNLDILKEDQSSSLLLEIKKLLPSRLDEGAEEDPFVAFSLAQEAFNKLAKKGRKAIYNKEKIGQIIGQKALDCADEVCKEEPRLKNYINAQKKDIRAKLRHRGTSNVMKLPLNRCTR